MAVAPEATQGQLAAEESKSAERLFEEHSGWIYGYCLRVLRSREEAEDALQTTYLNACRSIAQGTRPTAGSAWLLRIAQNVCLTRLRSSGRRNRVERVQDMRILEDTAAAVRHHPEELVGLTDALCHLPEQQRKALLLREWKGLSYREVAGELGITQSAVETLIFRARRSLAVALENPPKRSRLRSLGAFDLAGLFAAVKGLFAGGVGVKAVATVVVAATTATVVATDPVGVWPDRQSPGQAHAQAEAPSPPAASRARTAVGSPTVGDVLRPMSGVATPTRAERERGRSDEPGANRSSKAKANANAQGESRNGNGKANAPGQAKKAQKAEKAEHESDGRGRDAGASTAPTGRGEPPAHAKAKGLEQPKQAKASHS